MPLWDKRCTECDHKEYDLFERINSENKVCPSCGQLTFIKVFSAPHLPPDGLYSFMTGLDNQREKAHAGHGNASYKV